MYDQSFANLHEEKKLVFDVICSIVVVFFISKKTGKVKIKVLSIVELSC